MKTVSAQVVTCYVYEKTIMHGKILYLFGFLAVWPVKSRQMSLKVAQKGFTKIA